MIGQRILGISAKNYVQRVTKASMSRLELGHLIELNTSEDKSHANWKEITYFGKIIIVLQQRCLPEYPTEGHYKDDSDCNSCPCYDR